MSNTEIYKMLENSNQKLLGHLKINKGIVGDMKEKYSLTSHIFQTCLRVMPLYGGGLGEDGEYEFLITLDLSGFNVERDTSWKTIDNTWNIISLNPLKKRNCFKCGNSLKFSHFSNNGMKESLDYKELEKIWNDDRIEIYCCKCIEVVRKDEKT